MKKLMGDPDHITHNLFTYAQGFSPAVRDIELNPQAERLFNTPGFRPRCMPRTFWARARRGWPP